jgi:hypothetical protein
MAWNNFAQAHAMQEKTLGSSFKYCKMPHTALRHCTVLEKIQNTIIGILIFILIAFTKRFCHDAQHPDRLHNLACAACGAGCAGRNVLKKGLVTFSCLS